MLKFKTMEKLAHGLENVFKGIREKRYEISESIVHLVLVTAGKFREGARLIREKGDDAMDIEGILKACELAHAGEPFDAGGALLDVPRVETGPRDVAPAPCEPMAAPSMEQTSVRVKTDRIDAIIRMLNNLIINQFQFKKHFEDIVSIEEGLRARDGNALRVPGELLKKLGKMRKSFREQIEIIERDTFDLQESVIGLRLFPLEIILGSLPGMVEELSISLKKRARLSIAGGDVAIDKLILETIHDPLIHLVRNAMDHGLETPKERARAGKDPEGKLDIACRAEGGGITITLRDDGRGIDYRKVRARAAALFPARKDEIEAMSEGELASLLFLPGFSTSGGVTELSGRGVGLDIVKHNIEKVKGRIFVESEPGTGTLFTLTLPLSLATIEGYFVRSGGLKYFVPANYIGEVLMVARGERIKMLNRDAVRVRDKIVPLYDLAVLLNHESSPMADTSFALIVESLGTIMGLVVESVLEYVTLIYKALPKNIREIGYLHGIVFDESYDLVTILHVPALIERSKRLTDMDLKTRYTSDGRGGRTALVTDDSLNSREIQKAILETAGYNVLTARDGIEALDTLRSRNVDIIITDLMMPRMDGFTLMENLQRDGTLGKIPVVVVSNDDDGETSRRALAMGAKSYIVKSDFDRNNLVEVVEKLIG